MTEPSNHPEPSDTTGATPKGRPRPGNPPRAPKTKTTTKLTISVPNEFAEQLRNTVVWLQQQGHRTTLTGLLVDSATERITQIESELDGTIPERDPQWSRLVPGALPGTAAPDQ